MVNTAELLELLAAGRITLADARKQLEEALVGYHTKINDDLCLLVARHMNRAGDLRRALAEVEVFLSGQCDERIKTLAAEKETQVANQKFTAAAELNEQIQSQRHYWHRDQLLKRVRAALTEGRSSLPIAHNSRELAACYLLQAVEAAGSWLSAALDDPKACGAVKGAFRAVLDAAETALREGVGNV